MDSASVEKLKQQFNQLQSELQHRGLSKMKWMNNSDFFVSSSFFVQSDELQDYLLELKSNISKIGRVSDQIQLEYLSERIRDQFACLTNLMNSLSVNAKQQQKRKTSNLQSRVAQMKKFTAKISKSSQELYAELSKLQEFERRLTEMVAEKQHQLASYSGQKLKTDYQQQVLTTQQRLGRCRKALSELEEQIQELDNRN